MNKLKAILIAMGVIAVATGVAIFTFKGDKVYTVTFDSNGGTKVAKQEVKENEKVEEPDDPTKEGYNFKGWFLDGKKYNFDKKVTEDIELSAKWSKVTVSEEEVETYLPVFNNVVTQAPTPAPQPVVKKPAVVTVDLPESGFVGEPIEFTVETLANDDKGLETVGVLSFSNILPIANVEYYDEEDDTWYGLSLLEEEIVLKDSIRKFRITLDEEESVEVTYTIFDAKQTKVLFKDSKVVEVGLKPAEVAITIPELMYVGEENEFSITTMANGYAGTMVVGIGGLSDETAIESLQYLEVRDGKWYDLPLGSQFGPATGFPLTDDATSNFKVSFNKVGEYTVSFKVVDVDTQEVLAENTKTIKVELRPAEVDITIPELMYVGEENEFSITTMANGYAGTMVVGTGGLSDETAIESLQYLEVRDNTWYDLPLGSQFGPATGFPLTDDATSNFKVSFNKVGEYTVSFKVVDVDTQEVLAENTKTIKVELRPAEVTNTIPESMFVGETKEYGITTMANGYAGTMVVGEFEITNEEGIEKIEYLETQDGKWYDLPLDTPFGPATGFPLTDNATSNFRVSFNTAGEYTVTFRIVDVVTGDVLTEGAETIVVSEQPVVTPPVSEPTE